MAAMSSLVETPLAAVVRARVHEWRAAGQTVGFVPTMGNLHAGHLSLVKLAARATDRVVVSLFVNPTQFGPNEDFASYPRTPGEDRAQLARQAVDLLFAPSTEEVYPFGKEEAVRFVMPALSRELCGAARPGHFDGVGAVVCRLLNIVAPDVLVLGQKDLQQFVLLERLAADLRMSVRLVRGATVRESDGLAMSSRNRYLDAAERARARELHATIAAVRDAVRAGRNDFARLEADAGARLAAAGFRPDYVSVRRAADLAIPQGGEEPGALAVLAAAYLGRARLIDNVLV
jgi:pantoate--beta-alanine ligase